MIACSDCWIDDIGGGLFELKSCATRDTNRVIGTKMNARLEHAIAIPFHEFLGVTSATSQSGRGELLVGVSANTVNPSGLFHGGAIYALCDVCAYAALLSLMDDDTEAVTNDIHVSLMRGAGIGDVVQFSSEVVKHGRRLCFIEVKATLNGALIASASVTKSILPRRR